MKLRLALFALALLVMGCEQNPYLVGVGFRTSGDNRLNDPALTTDDVDDLNVGVLEFERSMVLSTGLGVIASPTLVFANVAPNEIDRVVGMTEEDILDEHGYATGPEDPPLTISIGNPDVLDILEVPPEDDPNEPPKFVFVGKRAGFSFVTITTPSTPGEAQYPVYVIWQ